MIDAEGKVPVSVEIFYDGVWNDITCDGVNASNDLVITRGRQDEGTQPGPSTCSLTLNNTDGRYSPRNPNSPLYGKIGRNTPLRVRMPSDHVGMSMPGVDGSYANTPDTAVLDIVGDFDVRVEVTPATWRPASFMALATKQQPTSGNTSWALHLLPTGALELSWSTDGTNGANRVVRVSTAVVPSTTTRVAVRAVLDVNNGASGHTVTFYTAPDISGGWTQLGSAVTNAGVTSVFSGASSVAMGAADNGGPTFTNATRYSGWVHAFELRNGINGTVVANPSFADQDPGTRTFTDPAGRVWYLQGGADIADEGVRFRGEVTAWPPRWDLPDYAMVPIQAKGVLRRLGQGNPPLRSAMYRGMVGGNVPVPKAYWPCEDGNRSTVLGSALNNGIPMVPAGPVKLAAYSDFDASDAVPTIGTGSLTGTVPAYTPTNFMRVMALVKIPDSGVPAESDLINVLTDRIATQRWILSVNTAGNLRLRGQTNVGSNLVDTGFVTFNLNAGQWALGIYLVQNGANIDYQIFGYKVGAVGPGVFTGTINSQTIGIARRVVIGGSGDLGDTAVGHVAVLDTDEFWDMLNFIRAWNYEFAYDRIIRLCSEEGVPLQTFGGTQDTQAVGPQSISAFLDLAQDAADSDMGVLAEAMDREGLSYRPRRNLYNQTPAVTLDYREGEVSAPFEPEDDDQLIRNDITVSRPDGSSYRVVQDAGPLSVLDPPDGVGRYDEAVTVSVGRDDQLPSQASWRVHLGTVDEYRFPSIKVDLYANPTLIDDVITMKLGDRIVVNNLPEWVPPKFTEQLVQGWTERINTFTWDLVFNCTPASPWNVGITDTADGVYGRADTAGCSLVSSITNTATSFQVITTLGPRWTTDATQLPFDVRVDGEVMRVTAISGTTTTQTFTVTRGINGIQNAHAAGADVALAYPAIAGL